MRNQLRNLFSPLLNIFESGTEPCTCKPSQQKILLVIGALFSALAILVFLFSRGEDAGYLLPVLVFAAVGVTALVIGLVGNDRAVAKIRGSRE